MLEFKLNWDVNGFSEAKQTIYESKDMDLAFYLTKAGIKTEIILK
ncbi:MAG TPA: hypothetical protein VFD25_01235 [Clostridia bacterium]|nr:hypothetical protein [Clostridia bacterium]